MNLTPPPLPQEQKEEKQESATSFIVNNITASQFDTLWEKGLRLSELDLLDFIIE